MSYFDEALKKAKIKTEQDEKALKNEVTKDNQKRKYGVEVPTVEDITKQAAEIAKWDTEMDVTTYLNQAVTDGVVSPSDASSIFKNITGGELFGKENQQNVVAEAARRMNGGTPVWVDSVSEKLYGNYSPEQASEKLAELDSKESLTLQEENDFNYLAKKYPEIALDLTGNRYSELKTSYDSEVAEIEKQISAIKKEMNFKSKAHELTPERRKELEAELKSLETKKKKLSTNLSKEQQKTALDNRALEFTVLSSVNDENFENYVNKGNKKNYKDFGSSKYYTAGLNVTESPDKYRAAAIALAEHNGQEVNLNGVGNYEIAIFRKMSDKEFQTFAYWLGKDEEKAKKYIDGIEEQLVYRRGADIAKDADKWYEKLDLSLITGLEDTMLGIERNFKDQEYYAPSANQAASYLVGEKLKKEGKTGQKTFYEGARTISAMAPSILVSTALSLAVPGAGAVTMAEKAANYIPKIAGLGVLGASTRGNAYAEMINAGYTEKEAKAYGNLVAASEIGLEFLIGGISKLGGISPKITKMLEKTDNVFARMAIQYTTAFGGEFAEEGLQTFLEPYFKSMALGYETGEKAPTEEVLYNALLGGFVGLFFESPEIITKNGKMYLADKNTGRKIYLNQNTEAFLEEAKMLGISKEKINKIKNAKNPEIPLGALLRHMVEDGKISEADATKLVSEGLNGLPLDEAEQAYYYAGANGISAIEAAKMLSDLNVDSERAIKAWQMGAEKRMERNGKADTSAPTVTTRYARDISKAINETAGATVNPITRKVKPFEVKTKEAPAVQNDGNVAETPAVQNTPVKAGKFKGEAYNEAVSKYKTAENAKDFDYAYTQGFNHVKPSEDINLEDVAISEAYLAGVSDSRAVVSSRANFEARTPGLNLANTVSRDIATNLDDSTRATINNIGKKLGVEIVLTNKNNEIAGGNTKHSRNSSYNFKNGVVTINVDEIHLGLKGRKLKKNELVRFILAHEGTHRLQETSPEAYAEMEKIALSKSNMTLEEYMKKWNISDEAEARGEIVADYFGDLLSTKAEVKALLNENRSLWDKILEVIDWLIYKLKGAGVAYNDIAEARELFRQALDETDATVWGAEVRSDESGSFGENALKPQEILLSRSFVDEHTKLLDEYYDNENAALGLETLKKRYEKIVEIWDKIGGELNSDTLKKWNESKGKDRAFQVFKTQVGYKYNMELSTMCKKGIPLFEAIDTIVKKEVMKELGLKTLGKAEKAILYDILQQKGFDIPCAVCYVEQARQEEGRVINYFLDGHVDVTKSGKINTYKLGWNNVLTEIENEMKAQGVSFKFPDLSREAATDIYSPSDVKMDEKTQNAFFEALKKVANKEITRANKANPSKKPTPLIKDFSPENIKKSIGGRTTLNLKIFKTLYEEPLSRVRIDNDLLYSSAVTKNLASWHHQLYTLFNMQGGSGGYKTKQGAVVYWGDILKRKLDPNKVRREGGIRSQSNSDSLMYTLLDQAQALVDATAKGYYIHQYTKVLPEVKVLGLSGVKQNISFIPKVYQYKDALGNVDEIKTKENAGLDKDGNPWFDGIEGVEPKEAFMILSDKEYSKDNGGICIGFSDKHISKLLEDKRISLVIGFHDSSDDGSTRYKGAEFAKNYNGENEATKKLPDGSRKTVIVGFDQFVLRAENRFKNKDSVTFNGKTYKYDDIPLLAVALYLDHCDEKGLDPAYSIGETDFSTHPNYYKLLANYNLYDSEGHYAPHRKVEFFIPEEVPALDEDGNKTYVKTSEYIKNELAKELTVRDNISYALSDTSSEGVIPRFKEEVEKFKNKTRDDGEVWSRSEKAPTFYSHMNNTIDGMKDGKHGANSIVPYLKGKGVKDEEIKWSGIETFLDGKKSVTKEELQEFARGSQLQIEETVLEGDTVTLNPQSATMDGESLDLYVMRDGLIYDSLTWNEFNNIWESDSSGHTFDEQDEIFEYYGGGKGGARWGQYKLTGGKNYREITFTMPDSEYTNQAMRVHWGGDAEGILAHARVQDFEVDGKKMLFIEEIQSDWHNEGHKEGYSDKNPKYEVRLEDHPNPNTDKKIYKLYKDGQPTYHFMWEESAKDFNDETDEWFTVPESEILERLIDYDRADSPTVPDAPFRNNYHEYVLKSLIRMAAEQGYDSIGWTPADVQTKRWSGEFAEGYRIEYDQDIPKFLNKYGKKWGTKVGTTEVKAGGKMYFTTDEGGEHLTIDDAINAIVQSFNELTDNNYSAKDVYREENAGETVVLDKYTDIELGTITTVSKGTTTVWSMPITDAMKESVLYEGQPLYSRSEPEKTFAKGETDFSETRVKANAVLDIEKQIKALTEKMTEENRKEIFPKIYKLYQELDKADKALEKAIANRAETIKKAKASKAPSDPKRWQTEKANRTKGKDFKVKGVSDIISKLEHDFGIPISSGHISERNARGIYKVESEAVRTKDLNNLPTALHEVGHHLTRKFDLTDVSKDIENELIANADASFLDQYKDSEKPGEAVAEFFRNYFQNAEKAEKSYPLFTKYLFSKLDKKTADIVNENADIINNYYVEASKTATSAIKLAEEKSTDFRTVGERFSDKTNLLYQSWYDSNHAIKLFTDEVENRTAYTFATNAAYADSRAYSMVIGDLYSIDGVKVGEGLSKALENINTKNVEEYKEFGEYLICKNGIERLAEGLDVWANEIQNTEEWMSSRIKKLEAKYPGFKEASERLYAFQKSFLNEWGVKSGLVSEESAKSWAERWQYYVPFTRKMETVSRISKKRNQADSTIKKAKGSKRDFQHPIDSIMFNMQKMVSAALTNRVRTEISNQAEIVPGTGYIIEKIPTPMVADNFNVSELVDELNDAFMSNFESEEDIERGYNILLSTFGEDGKITKYQRGKANGDIITILKNGKPEFYQVHDTLLLESLVDLEPSQVNPFVKAIKTVNALLTWGATGGNLTWNIFSNMPRDLGTLLAYNKKRDALKLIGGIFQAYFNKSKNALGKKTNPVYQEFLAMGGGGGSSRMTADKNYMESLRKKMGTVNKRNNPLKALLNAVEFVSDLIEAGPRYSVYKLFRETYNLTPDEAFYMSMDATTNFRRSGKYSKMINGVVPFFNAAMQGTNRFARYFTCSDLATTNPDVYYDKGKRGKAIWARSLTFVTASAIFGILRSLINSRDDEAEEAYTRLSNYVKNNYYVFYIGDIEIGDLKIDVENIPIIGKEKGKFFAIPKPREIATASSFAERMTDFIRNDDKHAFDEFYDYFTDNLTPPVIQGLVQLDLNGAINGFGVIGTASSLNANKDYMGRPIVSQSLEGLPAKEQYDRGTSKMAYWIGQASAAAGINDGEGLSPKQIDYFMGNVFGFAWKHPKALLPMEKSERDFTLGIKTKWIKDPLYSTDVTNRMYNNKDKLSRQSKANPEDFETKAELKDYTYYTDFFTKYNKLTKDEKETKKSREIRDKVLDILEAKEDEFESGKYDVVTEELIKIAAEFADASAISSAGDVAVDVNGEPYSMTSKEYFNVETYAKDIKDEAISKLIKSEYYNDLSWKEKSDAAEDLKVYGKEMALEKYIPGYVTDDSTAQKIKAVTNNANLSPEDYILYQIALDMVDKPNKSGNLGTYDQKEASAALKVFKDMTKTDITDEALALLWQIQTDGVSYKNPYGYAIRGTNWYRPNGKDQYDKLWMKER